MDDQDDTSEEWSVIESDTDETCQVCRGTIHAWQAVGRVRGEIVHAKCYKPSHRRAA